MLKHNSSFHFHTREKNKGQYTRMTLYDCFFQLFYKLEQFMIHDTFNVVFHYIPLETNDHP